MSSKVVEFPYHKISNPVPAVEMDHEKDVSHQLMAGLITNLGEYGYDATDPELFRDLGVVMNMLYATLRRSDGMEHFLHEYMEDLGETFINMSKGEDK